MKLVFLIVLIVGTSNQFSQKLLPNNNSTCLFSIFSMFSEYNSLIICTNKENISDFIQTNTTKIVFKLNEHLDALYFHDKMKLFMFSITNLKDLDYIYKTLYNFRIWNPRAKFVISFEETVNLNHVFSISWYYYVTNIIVIKGENIYTYYPYRNTNCGANISSTFLTHCDKVTQENIYPEKVPPDLEGCPVTLSALVLYPLVINASANRAVPSSAGLEIAIMHNIAGWLNFSENYSQITDEWWGVKHPNGSYTKGYGRLQRREVDIMFGFGHAEYFTSYDLDASVCHYIDITNFWVPLAGEEPKWKKIISIFNMSLWLIIVISIIVHGVFWWVISHNSENNQFRMLSNCLLTSWSVLLQTTLARPKNDSLRISYFVWSIMSLCLYTAYNSKLVSFLTTPEYEKQINSMKEILESNKLTIGLFPDDYTYFDRSNPNERIILDTYITCYDFYGCIDQMAYYKNYSIFINKSIMKFFNRKYAMSGGASLVFEVHEYEIVEVLRYNMVKGFPLLDRINFLLTSMTETGLIRRWMSDVEIADNNDKASPTRVSLTLKHMQTAFYFLFLGLGFSSISFVIEIFIVKYWTRIKK